MASAFHSFTVTVIREGLDVDKGYLRACVYVEELDGKLVKRVKQTLAWAPEAFALLLSNGAHPRHEDLRELSRNTQHAWLKKCCLDAVTSAENPLVPGLVLSVTLADAEKSAPEGMRRKLKSLREVIDALLLEILERLPQTVLGFEEAMRGCSAVFEPEITEFCRSTGQHSLNGGFPGPLMMALQRRTQTEMFCTAPLVVDFLSRKFTRGLPNWWESDTTLQNDGELIYLRGYSRGVCDRLSVDRFLSECEELERVAGTDQDRASSLTYDLEGAFFEGHDSLLDGLFPWWCTVYCGCNLGSIALLLDIGYVDALFRWLCPVLQGLEKSPTIVPGVQFVAAGLVAKPGTYYEVPALRMVLDFVIYLGMLIFFSSEVLLHEDGAPAWGEYAFAVYMAVSKLGPRWRMSSLGMRKPGTT